ncbi:MAG: hypothetical protein V4580_19835 [Bacteroidota bacterium]
MKTISTIIIPSLIAVLAIYFYKVTLTIGAVILLLGVNALLEEMKHARMKRKFRAKHNGKHFLWYSSNKRLIDPIEKNLKPLIHLEFETIYNNKSEIDSYLVEKELRYLRRESYKLKLPLLLKIEKEKIKAVSFYEAVYEWKEHKITQDLFEKKITKQLNKLNHGK